MGFSEFHFLTKQKEPDTRELVIVGIDAAKPVIEKGLISGMLFILRTTKIAKSYIIKACNIQHATVSNWYLFSSCKDLR